MRSFLATMFWLEVLGGARVPPRACVRRRWFPIALAVWWCLLLLLTVAFVGRSTKFIYVDF
jgi:peptidoglycan/LPS O-acetylase OafA/YrhL